jgi:SAM-dependent methyltransferase
MHHWADPAAGLAEIGRVLRPDGRALVWDLRPSVVPFHAHVPNPAEHVARAPLRKGSTAPWRWPWRLTLIERIEVLRADDPVVPGET